MAIQIKLTRGPVSSIIAGPFEDDIDAQYHAKQLRQGDFNPESVYVVVDWTWVIRRNGVVIGFYESEESAKKEMSYMVRADPEGDLNVGQF